MGCGAGGGGEANHSDDSDGKQITLMTQSVGNARATKIAILVFTTSIQHQLLIRLYYLILI